MMFSFFGFFGDALSPPLISLSHFAATRLYPTKLEDCPHAMDMDGGVKAESRETRWEDEKRGREEPTKKRR